MDIVWAEQYTVGQWMEIWFEKDAPVKARPFSHATCQGYPDNHIKPAIGTLPLGKLTALEPQSCCKELLDGGRVECIESKCLSQR